MEAILSLSLGAAAGFAALFLSRSAGEGSNLGETDGGEDDNTDLQGTLAEIIMGNPNRLTTSLAGVALIKQFEGLRRNVYDANPPRGDWTIGYGHKLNPLENYATISEEFATKLLIEDLAEAERRVNDGIAFVLNQRQFDAMVSLAFNLTSASWKKAASRLNGGEPPESVFPRYVLAGGVQLNGLVKRRAAELAFYKNGVTNS